MERAISPLGYSPDRAIRASEEDLFRRWPFAKRLADTVANQGDTSGLIIGLYGAWGEGKTSVLNLVIKELEQYSTSIVPVVFNPWRFSGETELVHHFFAALTQAVDAELSTTSEKIGEWVKQKGGFLSLGGWVDVDKLGSALSAADLETYKGRVEKALKDCGKRVVVIMDDIDRLDKNEIQSVFRLVKLSAHFDMVTYILAFDDEMVASALSDRYAGLEGGRRFLEKIVQIPLRLPKADDAALRAIVFNGAKEIIDCNQMQLTEEQDLRFKRSFVTGLEPRLKTPRSANRYLNAIRFALPMLKGEANIVDVMLIEGIRVVYPSLYETLREHKELLVEEMAETVDADTGKTLLKLPLKTLSYEEHKAAVGLVETLFPTTSRYWGSQVMDDERTQYVAEQRICSEYYFDRYFTYSIFTGELSDKIVSDIVSMADNQDEDALVKRLIEAVTPSIADSFVRRLNVRRMDDPQLNTCLGVALARVAWLFPQQTKGKWSPFSEVVQFVFSLTVWAGDVEAQIAMAEQVVAFAEPFKFVPLYCAHFEQGDTTSEHMKTIKKRLEPALIERVQTADNKEPLYRSFAQPRVLQLYRLWAEQSDKDAQEVSSRLQRRFLDNPEEGGAFLSVVFPEPFLDLPAPSGYSLDQFRSLKNNDFIPTLYHRLASVVDTDLLYEIVSNAYGLADPSSRLNQADRVFRSVLQFAYIYEALKKYPEALGPGE